MANEVTRSKERKAGSRARLTRQRPTIRTKPRKKAHWTAKPARRMLLAEVEAMGGLTPRDSSELDTPISAAPPLESISPVRDLVRSDTHLEQAGHHVRHDKGDDDRSRAERELCAGGRRRLRDDGEGQVESGGDDDWSGDDEYVLDAITSVNAMTKSGSRRT
jgi:hypothetical protein